MLKITPLPALADNYIWLLNDEIGNVRVGGSITLDGLDRPDIFATSRMLGG